MLIQPVFAHRGFLQHMEGAVQNICDQASSHQFCVH